MLLYQSISWHGADEDLDDESCYVIKNFGRTKEGKSVAASIIGFKPFFYVKVDEIWETSNKYITKLKHFLEEHLNNTLNNIKLVEKKDFWGFNNNTKFKFFKLEFKSIKNMKAAARKLEMATKIPGVTVNNAFYKFKLYETNIEPYIRMIHNRKIKPTGWIQINKFCNQTDILEAYAEIDVDCNWKNIEGVEINDIAPFIIASFDIECTSSGGDFPVPVKSYRQLANQIFDLHNKLEAKSKYDKTEIIIQALTFALSEKPLRFEHHVTKVLTKTKFSDEYIEDHIRTYIDEIMTHANAKSSLKIQQFLENAKWLSPLQGDGIIQIGTTLHRYGERECFMKHILTLGSCDHIEGVEVDQCETEEELLLKWQQLIIEINPDIITGYNIFGFDFNYMKERAQELGVLDKFMMLGRLKAEKSKYVEQKLSSSALGDNILRYIQMIGRTSIDMMKTIQRDHKLDSYKLDNVAQVFTGQTKDDVSPNDIFRLQKEGPTERAVIAKYCVQDCALCNHLVIKLEIIANNMGMSNVCLVPLEYIFMRGQGIKIYSLVLNECYNEGYAIPNIKKSISVRTEQLAKCEIEDSKTIENIEKEIKKIAYCCNGDTRLNTFIYSNIAPAIISIAAENIGASEVNMNMIKQAFPYGRSNEIDKAKLIIRDNIENAAENEGDDGYEGAIVLEPEQGIYIDKPVSVFDYASLYPSSMISENLSHDCIVLDEKYDNLPGVKYNEVVYDIFKSGTKQKLGERVCRYACSSPGIVPNILKKLLTARKLTRKKMTYKTCAGFSGLHNANNNTLTNLDTNEIITLDKDAILTDTYDEFQTAVLDGLQLAYKITANSLYGQIGAKTSQIYMKDIAACTTATGRNMIMLAKKYMEDNYGAKIIYGDTDSIFCTFPEIDLKGKDAIMPSIDISLEASKHIKPILKAPHDLEYEKTFWPFILLSKKRYVGNLYERDDINCKQKSMGIVLKRRDNANIVKHIYGGIIDIILNKQDINSSITFLNTELEKLIEGKIDMNQLIVSKSLKGQYKDPTRIAHKVLAERIGERDPGNKPQINDRIPYVYIKSDAPLQGDRIELPEYIVKNDVPIDYGFYITNQIMNPIIQIYTLIIEQLPGFISKYGEHRLVSTWERIKTDVEDPEKQMDKFNTIKEVIVKEMLFDPVLSKLADSKIKKSLLKKKYCDDPVVKKPTSRKKK
jgi:DNA polymerase elongation subunit (family B)